MGIAIAVAAAMAIVGAIIVGGFSERSAQLPAASFAETSDRVKAVVDSPSPLVGVSSCLGSSCHGGPREKHEPWRSAYSLWAADDPHAGAFVALLTPQSQDIYRRLTGAADIVDEEYSAFLKDRCTSCHATFHGSPAVARLREGVGCESCHGEASDWLEQHTDQASWAGAFDKNTRFNNTRDLHVRAKVCVGCHIGPGAGSDSKPSQRAEVNHDLIAAGHPRLAFEFAAYLSRMPAHWDVADDRMHSTRLRKGNATILPQVVRPSPFELEAWWAGQLASARRALEQLQARAGAAAGTSQGAVWPEFSENDCFACHHQLGSPSFRQQPEFQLRPAGAVAWGDWHFSALSRVLAAMEPPRSRWRGIIEGLKQEMARPVPDPGEVQRLTEAALGELNEVRQLNFAPRVLAIAATQGLAHHRWDEHTAWYLSAVPLLSAAASGPEAARPGDGGTTKLLSDVYEELRFRGPKHASGWHASPLGYDPQKLNLDGVRTAIRELYGLSKPATSEN